MNPKIRNVALDTFINNFHGIWKIGNRIFQNVLKFNAYSNPATFWKTTWHIAIPKAMLTDDIGRKPDAHLLYLVLNMEKHTFSIEVHHMILCQNIERTSLYCHAIVLLSQC